MFGKNVLKYKWEIQYKISLTGSHISLQCWWDKSSPSSTFSPLTFDPLTQGRIKFGMLNWNIILFLFYYQCHFLTQTCVSFVHRFSAHNWIWLLAKLFITMNWKIKIFENNFMFCIYFTLLFLYFSPPNLYLHFLSFLNTFLFYYENGGYSKCVMRASINDWGLTPVTFLC